VRGVGDGIDHEREMSDAEQNRIYLDPVLHGRYPAAARPHMLPPPELIEPGEIELIATPIDFIGINYYSPHYVKFGDWNDLRLGEEPPRFDIVGNRLVTCPQDQSRAVGRVVVCGSR
jgi:beta-glucosidase/6-phospho-beta-glucosidase/beta-galactosidase